MLLRGLPWLVVGVVERGEREKGRRRRGRLSESCERNAVRVSGNKPGCLMPASDGTRQRLCAMRRVVGMVEKDERGDRLRFVHGGQTTARKQVVVR